MSEMIDRIATVIESELWEESPKHIWAARIARAAIEAMREPTADMIEASEDLPIIIDDEGPPPDKAWRAMIDAALGKVDA